MKAYYLFGKNKLPDELKGEIEKSVISLCKLESKEKVLEKAYEIITTRYHGQKMATLIKAKSIFSAGAQDLWNRSGFLHCTNQNYLLTLLLIKSGHFTENDIRPKWTLLWGFSPHQYLRVKLSNNKFMDVDAWSAIYGIELGYHAHGLHTGAKAVK
jgi:hypothetical protein